MARKFFKDSENRVYSGCIPQGRPVTEITESEFNQQRKKLIDDTNIRNGPIKTVEEVIESVLVRHGLI